MPKLTIDGLTVEVEAGSTILQAAQKLNIKIPTLCYHPDQEVKANCRICVVEVEGQRVLQPSCAYPVAEGMVVHTNNAKVRRARKNILELILAHHSQDCLHCTRSGNCELQEITQDLSFSDEIRYPIEYRTGKDTSSPSITRDPSKCINCGRCIYACSTFQTVDALGKENRSFSSIVSPVFGKPIGETMCVNCGQCVQACPTGALTVHDDTKQVWDAIADEKKLVCAQVAPAVRITIAEALGEDPGTVSTGRLVTAMRMVGFDVVFDTDFTADLTIMEEGTELLGRLNNGGVLPMITSCSPGWIKFCETFYPDQLDHLSSCKSPQQMFGAIIKTFYAKKINRDPKDIFSVSIMPCTAKKFECAREEFGRDGYRDVDVVLTVQELARMIKAAGIDFKTLPDGEFDAPFGLGSGAGEIFGATGGVMEAALRTVYEIVTGKILQDIDFTDCRGFKGVKEATVMVGDLPVKIAIAHGLSNARKVMDAVRAGTADFHFIEIMACPGGCIGGGGNPIKNWKKMDKRLVGVYQEDKAMPIRKSHQNCAVNKIYKEWLGEPCGHISHELLHTKYFDKSALLK